MKNAEIIITAPEGIRGENASALINCALGFKSKIWIECREKRFSAKSLMSMLALKVVKGDEICIIAEGVDEEEAVAEVEDLCRRNFIIRK